MTSILYRRYN